MASLTAFHQRFIMKSLLAVFTLLLVLLFIRLGFWQLHRAHEKERIIQSEQKQANRTATEWTPKGKWPAQFQKISVKGRFLPYLFLLDNQHHEHQFGYNVISPLVLANKQILLIDRGWVPGDVTRQSLPDVKTPDEEVHLSGQTYYPSEKKFYLGPLLEKKQDKIAVIELLDSETISHFLHKSVYPFIIRLDKKEANGFVREWHIIALSPQRHYGYAFQWFAMAFVIATIFAVLSFRKTAVDVTSEH